MTARREGPPVDVAERSGVVSSRGGIVIVRRALFALAVVTVFGVSVFAAAPAFAGALEAPVTKPPTSVTGTTATLNGELNPNASGTVGYYFAYNTGVSCEQGSQTLPAGPVTGQGLKVSETLTALEGNTEYAFCVVATSGAEVLLGAPRTFVTAAIAPKVESESASSSTPFAAVLEAQVNPENQRSTSCVFEYGKTSVSEHSAQCSPAEVQGSSDAGVTASLTGLEAATTYKYRVLVADRSGETDGVEQSVETPAAEKPVIELGPLVATTPFSALIEARVNAEKQETSCVLVYGSESSLASGTTTTVSCEPAVLTGEGGFAEVNLTGLTPDKTYYYRMVFENAGSKKAGKPVEGPAEGEPAGELTTATLVKPVIEGESASASSFEAKLKATVNPEYQETTCEGFEYSGVEATVKAGAGTKVACEPERLGKGGEGVGVSAAISGLEKSTTYYYRVIGVRNATGRVGGNEVTIEHFETPAPAPPVLIREYSENITPFGVTVVGEINSEREPTSCYVEYTATESEEVAKEVLQVKQAGTKIPCEPAVVNGVQEAGARPVLKPNTDYFFHVIAENKATEEKHTRVEVTACCGNQLLSARTGVAQPPAIEKESTSEVTALHAKLEALVNPEEQATTVTFEYSSEGEGGGANLTNGKAKQIHVEIPAGLGAEQPVSADLDEDLTPGETYYYRVLASNETSEQTGEPAEGQTESFTTPAAPALTTTPAQNITTSTATLSGTINAEGVETSYHYVYINQALYEEALNYAGAGAFREIDSPLDPYTDAASTPEVTITAEQATHSVTPAQPATLTGLTPGARYEYALIATSSECVKSHGEPEFETNQCQNVEPGGGWVSVTTTVISTSRSFTVPSAPLALGATSVSNITQATATISGSVEPGGLPTRWELQLGSTPGELQYQASGNTTSPTSEPLTVSVGSLSAGTTYYYRFLALNPQTPINPHTGREEPLQTPEGSFTTTPALPPPALATTPPLTTTSSAVPAETRGTTPPPAKKLTNAQKLSKALKSCHAKHAKKRAGCEAAAHRKYAKHKQKG